MNLKNRKAKEKVAKLIQDSKLKQQGENGYDPHNSTVRVEMDLSFTKNEQQKFKEQILTDRFNSSAEVENERLLNYLTSEEIEVITESGINKGEEINTNWLRLSKNKLNYDIFSGQYYKFTQKIDLKLADDKEQILNNIEVISEVLIALNPLLKLVLGNEFYHYENEIRLIAEAIKEHNYDTELEKENLLLNAKGFTIHLITKSARIINHFLVKPQFTLEEFKQLINHTKKDAKLTLVEAIDTSDVSSILESISRIFPEIKLSTKQEVIFEPPITQELNYMVGGSAITSGCKALRGKDNWGKSPLGKAIHVHRKSTDPNSYISHYINDFKNPQEINFLPYKEAEQILDKFGCYPALLHLILAVHFYRQPNPLSAVFHLKGTDLIKDLGLHKRSDLNTHEKLTKVLEVVTAVRSLIITAKWSSEIKKKSGKGYKTQKVNISVEPSIMWDISPKLTTQKDLFGNEEIIEIDIVCKSGAFLSHFFNEAGYQMGKSLYSFATQCQKITDLDPFHEELALRIALLQSTMEYRQYYTVEQWLIENLLGAKDRISKAKGDKRIRKKLTDLWDKTLLALERIGYTIHFDERTYPQELRPNSPRKPRGYFERLLEAKIKLQPETLGKPQSEIEAKETEAIEVKSLPQNPTYSGQNLKEARLKANVTPKQLANYLKCSQGKIYNAEKRENLSKQLFKEIMDAINFVKKHPDKF